MKKIIIFSCLLIAVVFLSSLYKTLPVNPKYHTSAELKKWQQILHATPIDSNEYFLTAQRCKGCHGFDPTGQAMVDLGGNDVNLFDDWETSMMGLSAVDPLWRAKVSHESMVNPGHANELQNFCTSCHSPMGHYSAFYKGEPHYTLSNMYADSLGLNGVSCMACHSISPNGLGNTFSGQINYDTNNVAYGPFPGPFIGPMQLYVGLMPLYGPHVSDGNFCSPCHTLISNSVDLNGNATGTSFVEQATYHEWVNSSYSNLGVTCQSCHMPQIEDPVKIAVGYLALQGRSPYNLHSFAGANAYMVNLIKQNKTLLGVQAPDANFDSTLSAITRILKHNTLEIETTVEDIVADSVIVNVSLTNKAGHKFPTGYPARRAVVQLIALKNNGDTLFASGVLNSNGEFTEINEPYEPHYNVIRNENQVQVYEMIAADVSGEKTTVLERMYTTMKDNRIPPEGFTTTHSVYDTTKIVGGALTDPNFNKIGNTEGTGKDQIEYKIALNGYQGELKVFAKVYYQSVPAYWMSDMFNYNTPEINQWQTLYNSSDKTPFLVVSDSITNINITTFSGKKDINNLIHVYPNPMSGNNLFISSVGTVINSINIYDSNGKLVFIDDRKYAQGIIPVNFNSSDGVYYVVIRSSHGQIVKKVLKY